MTSRVPSQAWSGHPVVAAPLAGATLVEASAGTGKTATIVGLWLRLVVEGGLAPRSILVVTFTEAATAELKERIRAALFALRAVLDGEGAADPVVEAVAGTIADPARDLARARVRHAAETLDEAAVFTIHGFCQRLLGDHAFTGGGSFEATLRQSQADAIDEVARDFWRRLVGGAGRDPTLRAIVAVRGSPEALVASSRGLIGTRVGTVLLPAQHDLHALVDALDQAASAARQTWDRDRVEAKVLSKALNGNIYRADSMRRRCAEVDRWLQRATLPIAVPDRFDLFTTARIVEYTKKGQPAPQDDFFDAATALHEAVVRAEAAAVDWWRSMLADFVAWAGPELKRRKAAEGWQHFDDLLEDVHAALQSARGEGLVQSVAARFGAALIDEFQDTDGIQYAILSRLFAREDAALYLVGDPKQAIYGFRGADVHTYLAARDDTSARFALEVNRRSSPGLVAAVNAMFGRSPASFMMPGCIGFAPAGAPSDREPALDAGDALAPFVVWHVPGTFSSPRDKGDVAESIVRATADEVARLLGRLPPGPGQRPPTLRDRAGNVRPLRGGDIAILVGRHVEARPMRAALAAHGIATVTYGDESVLASPEAADMIQLLAALARPGDDRVVRAALGTRLFGWPLEQLLAAEAGGTLSEAAWEDTVEQFVHWGAALARSGPAGVYRDIVGKSALPARLLGAVDGDRALTNYGQLAEWMQVAWREEQGDAASLLRHLVRAIEDGEAGAEETQLRLESDEALVRIMTVHMAKGLEFPVVFCPYLWDSRRSSSRPKPPFRFHRPDDGAHMAIEYGSPDLDANAALRTMEDLAERVRVTYVALTRARERCYLVWGAIKEAHKGALAWLLHGPAGAVPDMPGAMEALEGRLHDLAQAALRAEVEALVAASEGAVSVCDLPPPTEAAGSGAVVRAIGAAAPFEGRIPVARRLSSFTSIVAAGEADAPDHDAAVVERVIDDRPPADDILAFPRGATAGSCLHAVMEALLARDVASRAEVVGVAAAEAAAFGIDAQAVPVLARMVTELLHTPLDPSDPFHLGSLPPERCAIEMEFHLPVEGIDPDALATIVARHRVEAGLPTGATPGAAHAVGAGYLKGYIDLVFEHRGRFWLADYKSNWLGPTLDHYRHEDMAANIVAEQYDLQYLLYTLALDRWLAHRVGGYDYAEHFGGVRYLYARGMRVEHGPVRGVYRARPSTGVVDALRRLWPWRT